MCSIISCTPEKSSVQQTSSSIDSLPVLRTVGAFSGTDQDGKPLSSESLRGHLWLGSFFFSRCESICPALNTVQSSIQKAYGDRLLFVSVSTDPEYDTPAVMKEYADRFGAKQGQWWFVNMPIAKAMDFASNGVGLIPPSSPEMHSTRFVLVDTAMRVRGYYDSADTADVSKLRTLLAGVR
ncbi:MAG: SCO family protein [Candidatus Kapabacteria bacterium]|nr:SCO family protein [Candidatus Kapabacteria bacterium]